MRVLITCGDPNGIGLELLLRAMSEGALDQFDAELILCAPPTVIAAYIAALGDDVIACVEGKRLIVGTRVMTIGTCGDVVYSPQFGIPTPESGAVARAALEYAARSMLTGECDAIVTLPVSKEALQMAGFPFPGQTEFFGSVAGVETTMILACDLLRVALVTIHVPIARVAAKVTVEREIATLERFARALREDWLILSPRIAVLGLNPHAGEHGTIGTEDERVLRPAVEQLYARGLDVRGPYPADGFFAREHWRSFDGVVAQYHDQGLIPVKMLAGGRGVNISAGLPIVRTSPDHGTAYDIVGTGRGDYRSVVAAIEMALYLARNRKQSTQHVSL
ncbi:MAG: 4-hydroxythreonine-4-phosphate dehydrogenase PdxA [Chlorobi bacterium]|nr:4-hydroxythreonine-4-phosphate dehydrogenase PdxA [Chlorobiota bacterium]